MYLFEKKSVLYSLGILFFLALVHYKGFDSDAALYLLQVVHHLFPERFLNDVPFMYGNQDSFSIFSPIIAKVYHFLGVNRGGFFATFVMLVAWGGLSVAFVSNWMEKFGLKKWTALLVLIFFVLLLNKEYGSGCFYLPVMESYLVARVLSEILMLAGLVFFFHKNKFISLGFFSVAALMHPLMGGWALPLWLFFHYPRLRIPVFVLIMLSPLSGFLHVGRLDFYPLDWRPLYYTPGLDEILSYSSLLLFWLLMYFKLKGLPLSKFSICLFLVSLAGFILQFVGCFSTHILLYQAQPFRVQWLCFIPVIPVFAIYLKVFLFDNQNLSKIDYGITALWMCIVANQQWVFVLLALVMPVIYFLKCHSKFERKQSWVKVFFVMSFILLFSGSFFENVVQLSLEQGVGDVSRVVGWIAVPQKLASVEKVVLVILTLVCVKQRRLLIALALALSFCNPALKVVAMTAILLYLVPDMGVFVRDLLIALTIVISFAEILSSLEGLTPFQREPVLSIVFLVLLFVFVLWFLKVKNAVNNTAVLPPLLSILLLLTWWNICVWDARDIPQVEREQQMDSFFETPLFPQVADRGKMLFVVEYEAPIQSRINFLTGAYADESIFVGEVLYKGQYMESNRRRSILLRGDSVLADMTNFKEKIYLIYQNPDTLLARVDYLCHAGEITHFVTDGLYAALPKLDSAYLDFRKITVYLYGCPVKENM